MGDITHLINEFAKRIYAYYDFDHDKSKIWYPMFYEGKIKAKNRLAWVKKNYEQFLKGTGNEVVYNRWFCSEHGAITALAYAPNGSHIIVGHCTGLIQVLVSITAQG